MQLAQWNPFREMEDMLSRFGRGIPRTASGTDDLAQVALNNWAPVVDISETEKEYLIRAELPGLKKEEVKLTVQNGVLTLSGERRVENEDKSEKHHRIERTYGGFTRSFGLPDDAVAERISAECRDGVLTVHVARSEAPKPRAIQVKIA